jgi:micrococcal nuclease
MTLNNEPEPTQPEYQFPAQVVDIVDGDTFDVRLDLGFELFTVERVRTRDIDTAETYGVSKDSQEYEWGMEQKRGFSAWVEETQAEYDGEWPFILYSREYQRGAYGRIIGDVWSRAKSEWVSRYLYNNYENVERYE